MKKTQILQILECRTPLVALEVAAIDWNWAIALLWQGARKRNLPLYYYSPRYDCLQKIEKSERNLQLQPLDLALADSIWTALIDYNFPGIYIIQGADFADRRSAYTLADAYRSLGGDRSWVLMDASISIPANLSSLIPEVSLPLPDAGDISRILKTEDSRQISACLGLSYGEIAKVMNGGKDFVSSAIAYKTSKLRGKGFETISEPDVPVGGLDLLNDWMKMAAAMLSPQAKEYNLSFPKGAILWGVPGTGKSLSAKHAAKTMGVPLIAVDWSGLISSVLGESERNLRYLLEVAELISPCIIYFDDFEKAFAGFDSQSGDGLLKRLAGILLTWMQERTAPILVLATVNRLDLPPELVRRFEVIFFVDMPSNGDIYDIFNIHLAKYFPNFSFTDAEWRRLIRAYKNCTPVEIALWVRNTAQRLFYLGRPGRVGLQDLLESSEMFVPAAVRESEKITEIRKMAVFARLASSPDKSKWAVPPQKLFEQTNGEVGSLDEIRHN